MATTPPIDTQSVNARAKGSATATRRPSATVGGRQLEHQSVVSAPERLVVVGMGMAAHGLCKRLNQIDGLKHYQVTVIGKEPTIAYDRVNLSQLFTGRVPEDLLLADQAWYDERKIDVVTSRTIPQIDCDEQTLNDDHGQQYGYDKLVIATGSSAFVPPIDGIDSQGVFVYRTLNDFAEIRRYVEERRDKQNPLSTMRGGVIGGGLLGLEAAQVLQHLGLEVDIFEMAPGLMPRQLDARGADRLRDWVEETGANVHLVRRTKKIERTDDDQLTLSFHNASALEVDILIVATGVRPNDQLAKANGLATGSRGGFAVNSNLETSAPNVFAVGECVSFHNHLYGLAAPCFRMADVLAERLAGRDEQFHGADESAELKLLGVNVITIGKTLGDSPGVIPLIHFDASGYRKLLLEKGRVVGASCVGEWSQLHQVRHAIEHQTILWPWQRLRFQKTGVPWAIAENLPVHQWPRSSTICSCLGIKKQVIEQTIDRCGGAESQRLEQVIERCRASTACGSCRPLVAELVGAPASKSASPGSKTILIASLIALLLGVGVSLLPPLGFSLSVTDQWRNIDWLWRNDTAR